jgi:RHS repeat-associated protein
VLAPEARNRPAVPKAVDFPEPTRWSAAPTGDTGERRPVRVRSSAAAGRAVGVEVFDRATAGRVGASGFVFRVTGGGVTAASGARAVPAELTVDYSGFAAAYGASYADRLRMVALPGCAVAQPVPMGCPTVGEPVAARNDRAARTLSFDVADVSGVGVYAVVSAVGGDDGTFAATPMSAAGTWQVAPGSGAFTYSYPVDVPEPGGGSAPSVALSYSSAVVDGLTLANNTQSSPSGLGWSDFANAFIERRYEPCFMNNGPGGIPTADLCWKSDNATISLGGISGPLAPVNAEGTEWRAYSDPGWRIQRLTGASYATIHQGQYWKVTGPDGTQYFFGFGHMPGRTTNSILAVPVTADNPGEPCRTASDQVAGCDQGWRWYLDRVVDPDGNVQSLVYTREENWYHSALGALGGKPMTRYHRGAVLSEISYGGRDGDEGWDPNLYSARVVFDTQWRCGFLVDRCPEPTKGHTGFPDVPTDLICAQSDTCAVHAPSFFTARRYAAVRTEVKIGSAWHGVVQHNLYHSFNDNPNGVAEKLQLESIQHSAIAFGKLNALPHTTFGYEWRDNRVDHGGNIPKAMRHNRLTLVTNPSGGQIQASYGLNLRCAGNYNRYPRWDENDRDCFPQSTKDNNTLRTGVFNKYLVTRVVEKPGTGSPDMSTSYTYEGTPAWAYDNSAFARDDDEIGWSVWRGYGTVVVTKGTTRSRIRVFRGWHDDLRMGQDEIGNWVVRGRRTEEVRALTGTGTSDPPRYLDHAALAGRTLEEVQLGTVGGVPDSIVESRRYEYEIRTTVDLPEAFLSDPQWVGVRSTTESVATAPGVFRQRRSQTTYNHTSPAERLQPPQPTTTSEEGWLDVTGDERCSITTYADNPALGMFVYPATNRTVAGGCTGTQTLAASENYYDGSTTLGAAPSRGTVTRQRTQLDGNRWAQTATDYDPLGRPIRVTGPLGEVTTTTYGTTPGGGTNQIPVRTVVTNVLGHQQITDWHPEFGVPKREQDANGNVTEKWYDEFGRITAVWLPTEPVDFAEPSWKFSYDIPNRAVRSQRLVSNERTGPGVVFEEAWAIYDGFWRERQSQGLSPAAGRSLVAETTYNDLGLVQDETVEQALTGSPGKYLNGGSTWQNRTRHSYDELGREVRREWLRGSSVAHATLTSYGVDTVTVTGPDGRRVRERVDGLGRTVAVEEFDGQAWVSASYGYDLGDRLTSVTDPAGNRITYTTNLAGWRTGQQDPNRGSATFAYDDAGNQTAVTDALGNQVHTAYDGLGRQVQRRAGSPTGPLLGSWTYDTAHGGKGKLHRTTRHTPAGDWVSEVPAYDSKGRPTGSTLVVPAGLPGLSGSYPVTRTYDRADRVRTVTYPAIGGLPQETVTTDYDRLGLATRMAGLSEYVWAVTYDDRGRRRSSGFGPRPGGATWMARTWTYDVDQRVSGAETFLAGSAAPGGVVSDHELTFDDSGNLTGKLTRQNGLAWRECFGYDARSRLTAAHTVAATAACDGGTPGSGDRAYAHTYRYSPDGRLTERTENGATTAYTYPAAGAARPHAPTRIGATVYTWDGRGSLQSRGGETFSWDVQGLLRSVTGAQGTTSFEYDTDGQRLLRRTPDGRVTVYLAGHEVTADATGAVLSAVRAYTFEGQLVATRSRTDVVEYLISDPAGSVELSVVAGATTPVATRAYEPFGQARAQTGDAATDRGFLGQVEDASTGLSYLNARYYDAEPGIFTATDPVYDTGNIRTLNPYTYSNNNPTTFADPSGMYSAYTYGLEVENSRLRAQNKALLAHIGRLNSHIEDLQGIIVKQQKHINKLITYIGALEAEIQRQASVIRRLQARIADLERVVAAQQREIGRLRRYIAYQNGVISYYKGVVNQLGLRLWGHSPAVLGWVMSSIHSGRGIPGGAFAFDRISGLEAENATLRADIRIVTDLGMVKQATWDWIHQSRGLGYTDMEITGAIAMNIPLVAQSNGNEWSRQMQESYDAGYDRGYDAGKNHKDWGDFAQETGCFIGGELPKGIGTVISGICYIASTAG